MRDLPKDNLNYPVLIKTDKGEGSGFYFRCNKKLFLVTAYHVLFNQGNPQIEPNSSIVTLISYEIDTDSQVTITVDLSKTKYRISRENDIALIEIATYDSNSEDSDLTFHEGVSRAGSNKVTIIVVPDTNLKKYDDVLVSNEVYILGFPRSIGYHNQPQIDYDRPLLRKGIIAGLNPSKHTIILDCPVYFGNSGGLAIEVEQTSIGHFEYKIIGVVVQFIPFVEVLISPQLGYTNTSIENSGYSVVVPIDTILELAA